METTYAFLKQNALSTILVVAVLSANGQIWLSNNRIQGLDDEIQNLRADMVAGHQAIRAEMAEGHQEIRAKMVKGDQETRAEMVESNQAIRADISVLGERVERS